jgi:hypothetical protein
MAHHSQLISSTEQRTYPIFGIMTIIAVFAAVIVLALIL